MGLLSKLFGGGHKDNPATSAMPYLNQIPGMAHEGYDPYIEQGKNADNRTSTEYENLLNDPAALINRIMQDYHTSEGYQFQKNQLNKEMSNTAAAGGIAGTPQDQINQAQGVQGLLSQDMEKFLTQALGLYGKGLEGEQGISNRGYDATKGLTDILGNNLTSKAGLTFQGKTQENENQGGFLQMLTKALGGGIGLATQPTASVFGKTLWGGK